MRRMNKNSTVFIRCKVESRIEHSVNALELLTITHMSHQALSKDNLTLEASASEIAMKQ